MSPPPGVQLQADPLKGPPVPIKPSQPLLLTPDPQNTLTQPAGNLATQRALMGSPDSSPLRAFLPDLESVDRVERSSLSDKLGPPGQASVVLEGGVEVTAEGDTLHFNTFATGQGSRGSVQSKTLITFHFDAGDPTMITLGKMLPGPPQQQHPPSAEFDWGRAQAFQVPVYPAWIEYHREILLQDADGRYCVVKVAARVDATHESFARSVAGRPLDMHTLMSVWGDKGSISVELNGGGPVQRYEGSGNGKADGSSIEMMTTMMSNQFLILNGARENVSAGTAGFIMPSMNAGEQFDQLEAFLQIADKNEIERRGPTRTLTPTGPGDGDDEDKAKPLSPVARGILAGVLTFLVGIALIFGGAALLSAVIPALSFMQAAGIVGGAFLGYQFVRALIRRSKEAGGTTSATPSGVLGAAVLDAFGISSIIEAATDQSILTGADLNRTIEERWESGTAGVLGLFAFILGARGSKSRAAAGIDLPTGTDLPAGVDLPAQDPVPPVDANDYSTPDEYLNALRTRPRPPTIAGPGWDHTRFPNGPTAEWRAGDPTDMPSPDGIYPKYDSIGRPRFWRNRATMELEARAGGTASQDPLSPDPIRAMPDTDLVNLRDTANSNVRSPRDPRSTGRAMEIEHFGMQQQVGRWLERAGFSASEARRLTGASNPMMLFDMTAVEHAFFDAEAHGFGRRRADSSGNMWTETPWADPRVTRPLESMSDAALTDIVNRVNTDLSIDLDAAPQLRPALQAEIAARGLLLVLRR